MRQNRRTPEPQVITAAAPPPNHVPIVVAALVAGVAWLAVFEAGSSRLVRDLLLVTPYGDKIGHFIVYGALAFAIGELWRRFSARTAWIFGPAFAWALGFADEVRQVGIRGRDASLPDLIANTIGIAVAAMLLYRRRRPSE